MLCESFEQYSWKLYSTGLRKACVKCTRRTLEYRTGLKQTGGTLNTERPYRRISHWFFGRIVKFAALEIFCEEFLERHYAGNEKFETSVDFRRSDLQTRCDWVRTLRIFVVRMKFARFKSNIEEDLVCEYCFSVCPKKLRTFTS